MRSLRKVGSFVLVLFMIASTYVPQAVSASGGYKVRISADSGAGALSVTPRDASRPTYELSVQGATYNIQRDYSQKADVAVENTSDRNTQFYLVAENKYTDIYLNFVKSGSKDEPLTINSEEKQEIELSVFAQNASRPSYDIIVNAYVIEDGSERLASTGTMIINVAQSAFNVSIVPGAIDQYTLDQTFTIRNNSTIKITDLSLGLLGEADAYAKISPAVSNYPLEGGQSVTVKVKPDLAKFDAEGKTAASGQLRAFSGANSETADISIDTKGEAITATSVGRLTLMQDGNPFWDIETDYSRSPDMFYTFSEVLGGLRFNATNYFIYNGGDKSLALTTYMEASRESHPELDGVEATISALKYKEIFERTLPKNKLEYAVFPEEDTYISVGFEADQPLDDAEKIQLFRALAEESPDEACMDVVGPNNVWYDPTVSEEKKSAVAHASLAKAALALNYSSNTLNFALLDALYDGYKVEATPFEPRSVSMSEDDCCAVGEMDTAGLNEGPTNRAGVLENIINFLSPKYGAGYGTIDMAEKWLKSPKKAYAFRGYLPAKADGEIFGARGMTKGGERWASYINSKLYINCSYYGDRLESITDFPTNNSDCGVSIGLGILSYAPSIPGSSVVVTDAYDGKYPYSEHCLYEASNDLIPFSGSRYCSRTPGRENGRNCSWFPGISHPETMHLHMPLYLSQPTLLKESETEQVYRVASNYNYWYAEGKDDKGGKADWIHIEDHRPSKPATKDGEPGLFIFNGSAIGNLTIRLDENNGSEKRTGYVYIYTGCLEYTGNGGGGSFGLENCIVNTSQFDNRRIIIITQEGYCDCGPDGECGGLCGEDCECEYCECGLESECGGLCGENCECEEYCDCGPDDVCDGMCGEDCECVPFCDCEEGDICDGMCGEDCDCEEMCECGPDGYCGGMCGEDCYCEEDCGCGPDSDCGGLCGEDCDCEDECCCGGEFCTCSDEGGESDEDTKGSQCTNAGQTTNDFNTPSGFGGGSSGGGGASGNGRSMGFSPYDAGSEYRDFRLVVTSRMFNGDSVSAGREFQHVAPVKYDYYLNGILVGRSHNAGLTEVDIVELPTDNLKDGKNTIRKVYDTNPGSYRVTTDTRVTLLIPGNTRVAYIGDPNTYDDMRRLPDFAIYDENIVLEDRKGIVGEPNHVTANVYNRGGRGGWVTVTASDGALVYEEKNIYIDAFGSKKIEFDWLPSNTDNAVTITLANASTGLDEGKTDNNAATAFNAAREREVPTFGAITAGEAYVGEQSLITVDLAHYTDLKSVSYSIDGGMESVAERAEYNGKIRLTAKSVFDAEGEHGIVFKATYAVSKTTDAAVTIGGIIDVGPNRVASFELVPATPGGIQFFLYKLETGKDPVRTAISVNTSASGKFSFVLGPDAIAETDKYFVIVTSDEGSALEPLSSLMAGGVKLVLQKGSVPGFGPFGIYSAAGGYQAFATTPANIEYKGSLSLANSDHGGYFGGDVARFRASGIVDVDGNAYVEDYSLKQGNLILTSDLDASQKKVLPFVAYDLSNISVTLPNDGTLNGRYAYAIEIEIDVPFAKDPYAGSVENPVVVSKSAVSISLKAFDGYEYSSNGGGTFQDSSLFSGLQPGSAYSIVQRVKETADVLASAFSSPASVTLPKMAYAGAVATPVAVTIATNAITLQEVAGYEYSRDNGATFQTSREFTGLSPSTAYSFVQRFKETATTSASGLSAVLTVSTRASAPAPGGSSSGGGSGSGSTITPEPAPTAPAPTSSAVTAPAARQWNPFSDVREGNWFYEDVRHVFEKELFNGISDTIFSPNTSMTRAMVVTVLWRQSGSPAYAGSAPFSDVPSGTWYTAAVGWAKENAIVDGVGENRFAPDASVTRQDLAVMLTRYVAFSKTEMADVVADREFSDWDSISSYAKDSVTRLTAWGIISGKPDNLFDPKGTATRAEVAAILHRFGNNAA